MQQFDISGERNEKGYQALLQVTTKIDTNQQAHSTVLQ